MAPTTRAWSPKKLAVRDVMTGEQISLAASTALQRSNHAERSVVHVGYRNSAGRVPRNPVRRQLEHRVPERMRLAARAVEDAGIDV